MKGSIKNTLTGCSHPSRIGSRHVGDQVVCHQERSSNSKSRSSSRLFCRYHRQAKECKNQRGQEEYICLVLAEVWAVETVFRPTKLNGARFDEKTVLPFDRSESASRGMVEVLDKVKR